MINLPQIEPKVFEVFSSDGKHKADIKNGVHTLYYYESILENSVIVSFNLLDERCCIAILTANRTINNC
jgi:hypothetical protein